MSTRIVVIVGAVAAIFVGITIWLAYPDWRSLRTRISAVQTAVSDGQSLSQILRFVENVEEIRARSELSHSQMDPEQALERDNAVDRLVGHQRGLEELISLLRIYCHSMYLDTEKTGTYQVVFFTVLRAIQRQYNSDGSTTSVLLSIGEELSLTDTDSGQFKAIIENKAFP